MSFVHLHNHTEYSILDATNKIKSCVARIKELGMTACAITDHGNMYGVIEFYKAMMAEGLNPILGCEVYVAGGSRFEKKPDAHGHRYHHLVLLAENNTGYQNLMTLSSLGFKDGFYYKPRVDHELLRKHHEGIICLSACLAGEIPHALVRDDYEEALRLAREYDSIFGRGNFFLELQNHGIAEEGTVNPGILRIAEETGIPLVVTNDNHYTMAEDEPVHELLYCLQQKKTMDDPTRRKFQGSGYYIRSEEEMRELFPYAQEAVDNTQKIADRCHVEIEFHHTKMPAFQVPEGFPSATAYLNHLCDVGLKARYGDRAEEIRPQMEYELGVIQSMGYVEYFLIVWDFINWAREHDVSVGPGRGSAAGSVVSYAIGITDVDPIRFQLIFERFLNPERVSMPDIDVDFSKANRGKVIQYVKEKYGEPCVSQIVTFQTMAARQVLKDTGKALGRSYADMHNLAQMIPAEPGMTIKIALEQNPDFKKKYQDDPDTARIIDLAMRLEGLPRQTGVHAAGVIIADRPIMEYIPVMTDQETGDLASQFTMTIVEELGLLKMDFLGLRTLTTIDYALETIQKRHGKTINMRDISYTDADVMKFVSSGKTDAVFQLESDGMKSFMTELKPASIEDLTAGIALYRPGPMDFIPEYIKGKNNPRKVRYDCPQMEPILKNTYGCIVYQGATRSQLKRLSRSYPEGLN